MRVKRVNGVLHLASSDPCGGPSMGSLFVVKGSYKFTNIPIFWT